MNFTLTLLSTLLLSALQRWSLVVTSLSRIKQVFLNPASRTDCLAAPCDGVMLFQPGHISRFLLEALRPETGFSKGRTRQS
jgi:hypothetical protein